LRYTAAMAVMSKAEINALSPEERMGLIDALWESFGYPEADTSAEAAHREIMTHRLAEYDLQTEELRTLDQIVEQLR